MTRKALKQRERNRHRNEAEARAEYPSYDWDAIYARAQELRDCLSDSDAIRLVLNRPNQTQ